MWSGRDFLKIGVAADLFWFSTVTRCLENSALAFEHFVGSFNELDLEASYFAALSLRCIWE